MISTATPTAAAAATPEKTLARQASDPIGIERERLDQERVERDSRSGA